MIWKCLLFFSLLSLACAQGFAGIEQEGNAGVRLCLDEIYQVQKIHFRQSGRFTSSLGGMKSRLRKNCGSMKNIFLQAGKKHFRADVEFAHSKWRIDQRHRLVRLK